VAAAAATLREQLEEAAAQTEELSRVFEQQAAELLGTLEAIAQRAHALRDRLHQEGEQLDHALDDVRELLQDDFTHACDVLADDFDLIAARVLEAAKGAHEAIDPLGDDWQAALEQEWEESLHREGLDTVRSNLHTVVQAAEDAFRHAREAALGELAPAAGRVDARAQAILAGVLEGAEALEAAGAVEREAEATAQRLDRVLTAFEDLQAYLGRFTFG
jgi:ABC-type transporter Mla subunit MlaD